MPSFISFRPQNINAFTKKLKQYQKLAMPIFQSWKDNLNPSQAQISRFLDNINIQA